MDYLRDAMGPVEKCLQDSGLDKQSVHEVVLIGDFALRRSTWEEDGATGVPRVSLDQDVEVMIDGANNGTVDWWRLYHDGDFLSAGLLAEFREDGELRIRGTLAQSYAFDLAEMFLAEQPVAPGDVVAVGLRADGVVPASVEHGGRVIGVVSTEPGLLLGGAFLDPSVLEQWGPRVVAEFAAHAAADRRYA